MTSGTTFSPPPAFGRFRLLHQIGAGVLGPVFRTHDPDDDRLVAVKAFTLDLAPEQAAALAEELRRLVALELPSDRLAAPLDAGVEESTAYLAQHYVAGESLDAAVRQYGPAPAADAARLISHVAEALDAGARVGVFHGTLHPRDVLVTPGETHLTGLGVASALERLGLRAPVRRPYAAPERESGGAWGAAADVFALAAIAHEVLTGRRALPGTEEPLPGLDELKVADAAALRDVLEAALDADPERRPASATEFANTFAAALGLGMAGAAAPAGRSRRRVKAKASPRLPGLEDPLEGTEPAPVAERAPAAEPAPSAAEPAAAEPVPVVVDPPAPPAAPPAGRRRRTAPVVAPPAEPAMVSAPEPAVAPAAEPPVVPAAEPIVAPVVEAVVEPATEPAIEAVVEPAVEPVVELVEAPAAEPVAEPPAAEAPGNLLFPDSRAAEADDLDALRQDLERFSAIDEALPPSPAPVADVAPGVLEIPAGPRALDTADLSGAAPAPEIVRARPGRQPERSRPTPAATADDFRELGSLLSEPPVPRALDPAMRQPAATRRVEPYRPLPAQPPSRMGIVAAGVAAGLVAGLVLGYWWGSRAARVPSTTPGPAATPAASAVRPAPATPAPARSQAAASPTPAPVVPAAQPTPKPTPPVTTPAAARPAPAVPPAKPALAAGRLRVRSTPDRADVFVDGVRRGVTPRDVDRLPYGEHTVRVTRPGYQPQERTVTIDAEHRDVRVSFTLTRPARRGAAGEAGKARPPATRSTPAPAAKTAPAPAAKTPAPAAAAEGNEPGALAIETRPPGARVRIDGRDEGVAPLVVGNLRPGRHTVRLELSGYRPWTTTLDVKAGARTRIAASLEPITEERDARR